MTRPYAPFDNPDRCHWIRPFAVAGLAGTISTFLPVDAAHVAAGSAMTAISLTLVASCRLLPWRRLAAGWQVAPPLLWFGVVAALRNLDGTRSGFAPLVVLPVVWLGLHGSRRQVHAAIGGVAAVFVLPLLLVGPPKYPMSDWRRALLWVVVAGLVGPAIHRLVDVVRKGEERERILAPAYARLDGVLRAATRHAVVATDARGTIALFGKGAEHMLGWRAEDVVGRHTPAVFHVPDEIAARAAELGVEPGIDVFATAARNGIADTREWTYVRRDGTRLLVELTVTGIREDDELVGFVGIATDVTAEREAAVAMAASEERKHLILSSLREGVVLQDRSGQIVEWNQAACDVLGLSPDELVGRTSVDPRWEAIHEDGTPWPGDSHPAMVALATGRPQLDQTMGVRRPDGELRWLLVNSLPLPGADGPDAVVTSFVDQTDRLLADQAILVARDRFSALVEHSGDLITVGDVGGRTRYASPAWRILLGWDPTTVSPHDRIGLVHPDDVGTMLATHDELVAQPRGLRHFRYRVRHADGSWRHLETTLRNLLDDPAVGGIVGNTHDVTEQVEAADRLAHLALHDELTGLPNRRLTLDRLRKALDRQRRDGGWVAVLFLDLEGFKQINDTVGHAAGDRLLVEVARRLTASLRPGDSVGRLGGDEFVVIGDRLHQPADAEVLADRLREALATPITVDGQPVRVGTSIGIVTTDGTDDIEPDGLLREADARMYADKQQRKDEQRHKQLLQPT